MSPRLRVLTFALVKIINCAQSFDIQLGKSLDIAPYQYYLPESVHEITIGPWDLYGQQELRLPLGGETLQLVSGPTRLTGVHQYVNYEFQRPRSNAEATFAASVEGPEVHGRVVASNGSVYLIHNLGGRRHVWIDMGPLPSWQHEMDSRTPAGKSGSDHRSPVKNEEYWPEPELKYMNHEKLLRKAKREPNTMAILTINLYYTNEYAKSTKDILGTMSEVLYKANKAFQDSNVKIRLELMCVQRYQGNEASYDSQTLLTEFWKSKGTLMHLLESADIAVLMVKHMSSLGIAAGNWNKSIPLTAAIVKKLAAEAGYSFAHEIAHLLGAGHNPETYGSLDDIKDWTAQPYGVGYLVPGSNKRTIMSYYNDSNYLRVNFFSSAVNRDRSGTALGDADHDVARLIHERRFVIEAIGDERHHCKGTFKRGEWNRRKHTYSKKFN